MREEVLPELSRDDERATPHHLPDKLEINLKFGQLQYLKNLRKSDYSKKGGQNPEPCLICCFASVNFWSRDGDSYVVSKESTRRLRHPDLPLHGQVLRGLLRRQGVENGRAIALETCSGLEKKDIVFLTL